MAGELTAVVAAVKGLMEEIATASDTLVRVSTKIPDAVVTKSEAVVLLSRARHGQLGTATREAKHYLGIIIYMPVAAYPQGPEDDMATLWNLMVDKFVAHVDLEGSTARSRLGEYRMGWETVTGVKCRRMIAVLEAHVAKSAAYSLS